MATLAHTAAGGARPGDLFGLLASQGTHALAIPMQTPQPNNAAPAAPQSPSQGSNPTGGTAPAGNQGQDGWAKTGNSDPTSPGGQPPPPLGQYDVSSDPVLQQVNAAMALADQNAQAGALRQRQQALTAYGDPNLAAQILGTNDPYATAAGQNQEGTVEQLLRAYQSGLHNFDTNLDPSLAYSGYRVGQEGQIGQSYQDNLAQAASAIQGQLGGYTDQLNRQLEADQQQRVQALADAYNRAVQAALAGTGG